MKMREKRELYSKAVQVRFRPNEITKLKREVELRGFLSVSELIRFSIKNILDGSKNGK